MYFLSKFCRICIQSGVKLLDLDTLDFDEVKLSDKLEVCTKMVINRESTPWEICVQCIAKLRISYQFYNMCKKSTKILQGYLNALICKEEEIMTPQTFVNTDLNVVVSPLRDYRSNNTSISVTREVQSHKERRKRITKEQRCSLLKRLLTPSDKNKKHRNRFYLEQKYKTHSLDVNKGGLRNIINFTKNYEFGLGTDKNSNYELNPLDKLKAFSSEFFSRDFSEFRNTILYIIEHKDSLYDSGESEDDGFDTPDEEEDTKENIVKFEEVIVEPDVKIKTEIDYEVDEGGFNYGECENQVNFKQEMPENPAGCSMPSYNHFNHFSNDSLQYLNILANCSRKRSFSPNNVRCRTRDNPYINPLLKEQFMHRSFKCQKCNRYFKSPGYLKAHYSKVH